MTNTTRPKASPATHDFRRISHSPVVFVRVVDSHPPTDRQTAEAVIVGRGEDGAYWSCHVTRAVLARRRSFGPVPRGGFQSWGGQLTIRWEPPCGLTHRIGHA